MADTASGRNRDKKTTYYGTSGGPKKTNTNFKGTQGGPKKTTKSVTRGTNATGGAKNQKPWTSPRDEPGFKNTRKKSGIDNLRQNTVREGRGGGYGTDGFMNRGNPVEGVTEEELKRMTFAEALAMAKGMGYGSGGADYGALEGQLRGRASESDKRLEAMYKQLGAAYEADAPVIQGQYDQAAQGVNTNVDKAASNTNAAYDNARAVQTEQMKALGIEDAAAVLASQGGLAAQDQAGAISSLEADRSANVNQITQNKASAGSYNTNIKGAGQLEGNLLRATNQSRLSDKLAELNMQRQQEQSQLQRQLQEAALGIYEQDGQNYNDRLEGQSREQRELAELLQREEEGALKQQQYQQKQSSQSQQAQAKMYAQLLSTFRSDPDPEGRAKAVMKNMMKSGMLG